MRTFGSLFAGVGGFDMGFEQAGFTCLFQVEWDKHCQSVLNRHWPDVPRWSDVQDVNGAEVPPCDVLIFGSPCQDLSVAGKRAGLDGGRSSMFFEATRIIKEMRNATGGTYPRVVVWENVPGALSSNKGADFQAVLDEMGDCGAHLIEWAVLDAQHFGVPQRRRRIFLVAVLDPATARRCPDPLFPVAEGRRGDYSKGVKEGQEIAGTLGGGSGSRGWSPDTDRMTFIPEVVGALQSRMAKGPNAEGNGAEGVIVQSTAVKTVRSGARDADGNLPPEVWQETDLAPTLNSMDNTGESRATVIAFATNQRSEIRELGDLSVALSAEPGTNQQTYIAEPTIAFTAQRVGEAPRIYEDSTPALLSRMGTGGNNTPMVTQTISFGWQENHHAGETQTEITTALTTTKTQAICFPSTFSNGSVSNEISPTLTVGSSAGIPSPPAIQNEYAVRRLTPLECERLMGWPDDHTRWRADGKEQSDSARYKQCGNGVATPVAKWIAQQLEPLL